MNNKKIKLNEFRAEGFYHGKNDFGTHQRNTVNSYFSDFWNKGVIYKVCDLNHHLEEPSTINTTNKSKIGVGTLIQGNSIDYLDENNYIGIINKICKDNLNKISYYIIQDNSTNKFIKINPNTATSLYSKTANTNIYDDIEIKQNGDYNNQGFRSIEVESPNNTFDFI